MGRVLRFLILIVVGFGLGAGLAWFQKSQQMPAAPVAVEQAAVTDTAAAPADAMMAATDATPPADVAGSSVGGAFTLTDHNGAAVTDQSWPGKMKLVFFGFTACPDICPVALDKITNALNTLGADAAQIQPLFITVDPARDNADALKAYLANYYSSFVGLTGTEEEIKAAEDAYKVYATKGEAGADGQYTVDHSGYVYLITEDNKLLEIFGSDSTAESMIEKIKPHLSSGIIEGGAGETAAPVTEESAPAETVVDPAAAPAATEEAPAATEGSSEAAPSTETAPAAESSDAPVSSEEAPAAEAPATEGTTEETPAAQ